ncbi:MAG: peptide chain release factor 2 [Deltaproteobacteria bacterium]|nr:peptide chain release factor 2 [Deltaproteobacteria bacterium]
MSWAKSSPSSGGIFDVAGKKRRISELEEQSAVPGFWDKRDAAQAILREQKSLKATVETYEKLVRALEDGQVLVDLAEEAVDEGALGEAEQARASIEAAIADMEFRRMLSGEQDHAGAILSINAGAGGVDAQDWAQMLVRMISRYCERKGWKIDLLDEQPGEEAGIKSATLAVTGEYAYGLLKAEMGVHRLVRISPFDANARRQTSFAAMSVSPDVEEDMEIEVRDEDLRIDVFRAGGAGGQHVNKTESAVRITHLPTGIVVQCQSERSQHSNKAQAMRVLKSRLYELKLREQEEKQAAFQKEKKAIEWGSQIRSYVLAPYRQVADHRTDLKVGNVDAVLDGEIEQFIRAFLLQRAGRPGDALP